MSLRMKRDLFKFGAFNLFIGIIIAFLGANDLPHTHLYSSYPDEMFLGIFFGGLGLAISITGVIIIAMGCLKQDAP